MDRQKAIETLEYIRYCNDYKGCQASIAIDMAIEALQEKDHRCGNCRHGDYAQGNVFYCLAHSSFHDENAYCSEWESEQE